MIDDIKQLLADESASAEAAADMDTPLVRNRVRAKEPAQVYSVRLPVEHLEDLRQLAERRGLPPTALMRRWVIERLDVELCRTSDLEQRRAEVMAEHSDEPVIVMTRAELVNAVATVMREMRERDEDSGRHAVKANGVGQSTGDRGGPAVEGSEAGEL